MGEKTSPLAESRGWDMDCSQCSEPEYWQSLVTAIGQRRNGIGDQLSAQTLVSNSPSLVALRPSASNTVSEASFLMCEMKIILVLG